MVYAQVITSLSSFTSRIASDIAGLVAVTSFTPSAFSITIIGALGLMLIAPSSKLLIGLKFVTLAPFSVS